MGVGGTLSLPLSFAEDMLFTTLRYLNIDKKMPGSRSPNKTTGSYISRNCHRWFRTRTRPYLCPRSSGWLVYIDLDCVIYRTIVMRAQLCNPQLAVMFGATFFYNRLLTIWKSLQKNYSSMWFFCTSCTFCWKNIWVIKLIMSVHLYISTACVIRRGVWWTTC